MGRVKLAVCVGLPLVLLGSTLHAQVRTRLPVRADPVHSAAPASARYEIVQSGIAARITLRLDKYTGYSHQLVLGDDDALSWRDVPRIEHPDGDNRVPDQVNYQIVTSGIVIRYTFLLNVHTGATWQLVEDEEGALVWQPIR